MSKTLALGLILLVSLVYASTGVSNYFGDADKTFLTKAVVDAQKKDGSFLGLKNTFYAVRALKALKTEVPNKEKTCEFVNSAPAVDAESIYYVVATTEALGCGKTASDSSLSTLRSALRLAETFSSVYYASSALLELKQAKHADVKDEELSSAVDKVLTFAADDGTFLSTEDDDIGSALNTGHAADLLARLVSYSKDKSAVSSALSKILSVFALAEEEDDTLHFVDSVGKASTLRTTVSVFTGIAHLAKALSSKPDVKAEKVDKLAQFVIDHKAAATPEDAYYVAVGVQTLADNTLHTPLVVSVRKGVVSLTGKSEDGSVQFRLSDILGQAKKGKVTVVRVAREEEKSIINNQDAVAGADGVYSVNLLAAKPEPGYYSVSLSVDKSSGIVRKVKVTGSVSIGDVTVVVAETEEQARHAEGKKFTAKYPNAVSSQLSIEHTQHLTAQFKVSAGAKDLQVQQAFVKFTHQQTKNEVYVVAQYGKSGYKADVSFDEIDSFLGRSGVYDIEIIIGDSLVENSAVWKVATANIKFPANAEVEAAPSPFARRPDIVHQFRAAEKRPPKSISFAFTIAALAPIAILLLGSLRVGFNFQLYPAGGLSPLYALGFHTVLGFILALYALYWLQLNMVQTLKYLGVLFVPFLIFANKTLNAVAAANTTRAKTD